jgi:hypothetical protein
MTPTEFLTARLDEDEAAAMRAIEPGRDHFVDADPGAEPLLFDAAGEFILPARVLREVEAKRAILAAYAPVAKADGVDEYEYAYGWATGLGTALRALAAVYSAHPDYDPAWA